MRAVAPVLNCGLSVERALITLQDEVKDILVGILSGDAPHSKKIPYC
jgi:hypothetical protein